MKQYHSLLAAFRIIVFLVFCHSLFFNPQPVAACSCIKAGPPPVEFNKYTAVFSGTVTYITDKRNFGIIMIEEAMRLAGFHPSIYYMERFWGYKVTFAVSKSWKFVEATSIQVDTGYGMGDCGYNFFVGNDYLVYASRAHGNPGGYLVTSICSRTAELSQAADDLSYLNTLPTLKLKPASHGIWGYMGGFAFLALVALLVRYIYIRKTD